MNSKSHHQSRANKHRRNHKKKHTGLKVFISLFVLLLIVISSVAFAVYRSVDSTFSNSYMNVPNTTSVDLKKSEPFTTLIIEKGSNNSKNFCYAAVLASTNAKTNQTTFMNFPVLSVLPNQKTITEVYNKSGNDGILQLIKELLNIPVNKVIQIDVDKIGSLAEATGGIVMQNPKAFNAGGYEFKQGTVNLQTAEQVQAYMTKIDDSDIDDSITRIQNVSMGIYGNIQKLPHTNNIKNIDYYHNLLDAFSNVFKTNVKFEEAKTIALNYNKALSNTSKLNLHENEQNDIKSISQTELDSVEKLFEKTMK